MTIYDLPRRSGKTTMLLKQANKIGGIVIEPYYMNAEYVRDYAKQLGLENVQVMSWHEFSENLKEIKGKSIMIDELDWLLRVIVGANEIASATMTSTYYGSSLGTQFIRTHEVDLR